MSVPLTPRPPFSPAPAPSRSTPPTAADVPAGLPAAPGPATATDLPAAPGPATATGLPAAPGRATATGLPAVPGPATATGLPAVPGAAAPSDTCPAPSPRLIGFGPRVPRRGNALSQWLGLMLLRLMGWRVRGHWPDIPKAVVIVAPHTSNVDGLLSVAAILALRLRLQFFMKHTAFPWPLAGLIRWFGGIPVNRGAAHDLVGASAEHFAAREQLLIAITPDGTRHAPKEWKKGFYWIAHRAGVPIICVGYDYARKEIVIRDTLVPCGDYEKDYPLLLEQFRGIAPRHPERLSAPLRTLQDG